MNIQDFKKRAIEQDSRNLFKKYVGDVSDISKVLQQFFLESNPIDVEITMSGKPVKFYPYESLQQLQEDYSLQKNTFIFATCNSDPIYLYDSKIYTCCHEKLNSKSELIATSFEDFLSLID